MYGGWIVFTVIIAGIPALVFKRPQIIKKYFSLIAEIENGKIIEIDATVIGEILILITLARPLEVEHLNLSILTQWQA
jgi:predicted metalloenzyme YecM